MHVSRGVNNNFLLLQRIMWGRAVLHWGSVKPAWRTSSQWFSSSSTSSWRQWQGSWSTRPSLTFWTKSTTPSCLSPTKKWTCFLLQVGMKKTHTGPWLFLCVRPLPLSYNCYRHCSVSGWSSAAELPTPLPPWHPTFSRSRQASGRRLYDPASDLLWTVH